jgi:hypothetical protein
VNLSVSRSHLVFGALVVALFLLSQKLKLGLGFLKAASTTQAKSPRI